MWGQHVNPKERFPESFAYFTADSINRNELSIEERQYIADYDNAVIYNDYVVNSIIDLYKNEDAIVLYFSDHGDEANDYRIRQGRAFDFEEVGPMCFHYQLDVPMFVWVSDKYKVKHPDIE